VFRGHRRQAALGLVSRQRLPFAVALTAVLASSGTAAAVSYLVLGGVNSAGATTTLKSAANGSVLQVTNTNLAGGTGARGVSITVPAGRPPLSVNSTAGKATNLDADKLDGLDASAFARGANVVELGNRLVVSDGAGYVPLLTLPGLGELDAYCAQGSGDATIVWRNTTRATIDEWSLNVNTGRLQPGLAPSMTQYRVASYYASTASQLGDTLVLGVGNSPGPRTTATVTASAFRTAPGAPCGMQAMATIWSTP
jgi:hypothetical protein